MNLLLQQSSSWDEIPQQSALIGLVSRVAYDTPYYYMPSEIPPTSQWLPDACRDTNLIFTAYNMAVPSFPDLIGYCVMKPYETYPQFVHTPEQHGVIPESCIYIAELGVDESARGHRIGSILLDFAMAHGPPETRSYLVRTPVNIYGTNQPNPAVAFYEKRGFHIVENQGEQQPLIEAKHQRPRLFLRKDVR
ncbi:MAG: GNAT family N-acetyltransferase [Chloroflexota bacterium]